MKIIRFISLLIISLSIESLVAKVQEDVTHLDELTVMARRPMKEIGLEKTVFDSLVLKENIALSMADVLTYNSSVYVKSYGRATLSTVAFRGTSPSHTQVSWNGIRINSPMLGMTDFSSIPAYFVDQATLLHGTSSVNESGGGIGGLVKLATIPDAPPGFNLQYVQGIGSFSTFDEFLRFTYKNSHWLSSTRIVYSSSPNDYTYVNHDKKINIYDEDHNIIGQYYPKEKNRSGAYKDLQLLQEIYYNTLKGNRLGWSIWYVDSNRELPMLTTDYGNERQFENKQRENTLRTVLSWNHYKSDWDLQLKAGYIFTWLAYDYKKEITEGFWSHMTRSRSHVNSLFASTDANYYLGNNWLFSAGISLNQHFVRSEDKNIILQQGNKATIGYDKARLELSGYVSAKWQPINSLGLGLVLREEYFGDKVAPLIPAFFADWRIFQNSWSQHPSSLILKGSVSRNYRFPSLNDLYFLPGGNPDLKSESGFTYDIGFSFDYVISKRITLNISSNWFDSKIKDWILWLPTTKGFFSPKNVKTVHAYGIETTAEAGLDLGGNWRLNFNGSFSWTPSINEGEKISPADQSIGKQLPYVPRYSASATGRLTWKSWAFLYKWNYYSERFTMSSNDYTLTGHLPEYFMNNISLEKNFSFKPVDLQLKLAVNNLFNEDYLSVLSRPMPGINFEFFIGITPKFINPQKKKTEE
ncbi:MAG: TonB-dependent receptor plug domain-containing protein [Muribaculaceae bacterium]|nr:TonB-dependent receptor plug domain-containing protein [Muribaculaceae bacterium]